jgi:hypothetical protein
MIVFETRPSSKSSNMFALDSLKSKKERRKLYSTFEFLSIHMKYEKNTLSIHFYNAYYLISL